MAFHQKRVERHPNRVALHPKRVERHPNRVAFRANRPERRSESGGAPGKSVGTGQIRAHPKDDQVPVCSMPYRIASASTSRSMSCSDLNLMQYPVTVALPIFFANFSTNAFLSSRPMM